MDLVDKERGDLSSCSLKLPSGLDGFSNFSDVAFDSGKIQKSGLGALSNQLCQAGFAHSRGAVKDQRGETICFHGSSKQLSRTEDMVLSDILIKVARTHPGSQGHRCAGRLPGRIPKITNVRRGSAGFIFKQVIHGELCAVLRAAISLPSSARPEGEVKERSKILSDFEEQKAPRMEIFSITLKSLSLKKIS